MADTLTRIKKRLNIDQRNLASCRVVSASGSTAKVRLPDGRVLTAYAPDRVSAGSLVNVAIAGSTAAVSGSANLQATGGMKIVKSSSS